MKKASGKKGRKGRRITCLTGTPGTGKSTIAAILERTGVPVLEMEPFARSRGIYSYMEDGETLVIDESELAGGLEAYLKDRPEALLVGHLSHHYGDADKVVVLRTEPSALERRLRRKGWARQKISENVEAEALDICLCEALQIHGRKVSEIDTTRISPKVAARMVLGVHSKGKRYPPKARNWLLDHILKDLKGKTR